MYEKLQELRARRENGEGGFTLIELLVVVVIIGILIAIAIPLYLNYQKGAHDKSAASDLRSAVTALEQCYSENQNQYPPTTAGTATAAGTVISQGSKVVFTCVDGAGNAVTETANLSSGTQFQYAPSANGTSYKASAYNSGGHDGTGADASGTATTKKTYNYDSSVGGQVGP